MSPKSKLKTALIIEDEADLRQFISWVLKAEGFRTLEAADGNEGLKIAKQNHADIIILDIRLPFRHGWDVLKELKDTPALADIPVIVFTASADPVIKSQAVKMGAADYLVKPLSAEVLKKSIIQALKKSKRKTL
jgi:DNA-binding response OmpR family regulator